jgi:hypothetical protein
MLVPLLAGCEVQWGGIDVEVREAEFAREDSGAVIADSLAEPALPELPSGPLLFHVRRTDAAGRATIEAVAELADAELKPLGPRLAEQAAEYISEFVTRYYRPDQAYTLFRGRTRVGTFYVRAPALRGSGLCPELRAEGQVELRPGADTLSEFHAWPPGTRSGEGGFELPVYRADMPAMAQVLARFGVRDNGIPGRWRFGPPADLRALQVGSGPRGFAATFMVADSLGPGSPRDSAGMAFVVADYAPARGYFPLYFDAEWYGPGQKRALHWIDAVDLVGDPGEEWLLRAYGDASSWYELVGQRDTARAVVWSSHRPVCEAQESTGRSGSG